ncbi:hypothetical protein MCOR25_009616 [Pyricularia grisea]|nr:hypothetical protein MCOR25_009616 [Pyricularia grisea]
MQSVNGRIAFPLERNTGFLFYKAEALVSCSQFHAICRTQTFCDDLVLVHSVPSRLVFAYLARDVQQARTLKLEVDATAYRIYWSGKKYMQSKRRDFSPATYPHDWGNIKVCCKDESTNLGDRVSGKGMKTVANDTK